MVYFCPDCKLVFDRHRIICPKCGFGTASDERNANYYVQNGYNLFTPSQPINLNPLTTEVGSLQDVPEHPSDTHTDIYTTLMNDYQYFGSVDPSDDKSSTVQSIVNEQPPANREFNNPDSPPPPSGADFFAQFANSSPSVPTIEEPPANTPRQNDNHRTRSDNVNTNNNDFDDQLNRLNRAYRRQRFFSGLRNMMGHIRWGWILRLIPIILIISAIYAIWAAREAILAGIINIIIDLIPLALIVVGIVYLIRSVFRR